MYSAAHLTGRLGATQCAGPVAAGERNSRAVTNSNACAHSNSHTNACAYTNPNPNTDSHAHTVRIICSRVERNPGLYRGHDCECERRELRG